MDTVHRETQEKCLKRNTEQKYALTIQCLTFITPPVFEKRKQIFSKFHFIHFQSALDVLPL